MSRRTFPHNAVDAFLITARHLNLTHAAKELCLTQGAVSRKIATLESWFGFALFERHARGLRLSPRAAPCFLTCSRPLNTYSPWRNKHAPNKPSCA